MAGPTTFLIFEIFGVLSVLCRSWESDRSKTNWNPPGIAQRANPHPNSVLTPPQPNCQHFLKLPTDCHIDEPWNALVRMYTYTRYTCTPPPPQQIEVLLLLSRRDNNYVRLVPQINSLFLTPSSNTRKCFIKLFIIAESPKNSRISKSSILTARMLYLIRSSSRNFNARHEYISQWLPLQFSMNVVEWLFE